MSGSPKYVEPALALAIQLTIEAARYGMAQQEARRRRQVEQEARARMSRQRSEEILRSAEQLYAQISANEGAMQQAAGAQLLDRVSTLIRSLRQGGDYALMVQQGLSIEQLQHEFVQAMAGEQISRLAQIRDQNARRRAEAMELSRQLDELGRGNSQQHDFSGLTKSRSAIDEALAASGDSDSVKADYHLRMARAAVDEHSDKVRSALKRTESQRTAAREELESAQALLEALQADPIVVRWTAGELAELETQVAEAASRLEAGAFGTVEGLAELLRGREAELVEKANKAQIKADQRDYIANSIRQVLEGMGFIVGQAREEHPGHPATAQVFDARNAAGKSISVSVPFEGEVWYDIEGYPKHSVSRVGGGSSAVCDEAEEVIDEMHSALEEEFQIEMGELMWEGKDPDRILRQADQLPRSEPERREDSR